MALMAYRNAEHASTKFSPNEMMLGREIRLPVDFIYGTLLEETDNDGNIPQFVAKLAKYIDIAHSLARENIKNSSDKQKGYCDYHTNLIQRHTNLGTPYSFMIQNGKSV